MSIRIRIILVFIPAIILLLGILMLVSFDSSKNIVLELINKQANEIARSRVMEFDITYDSSQKVAEGISTSISTMDDITKEKVLHLIQQTLKKNRHIFGSTVSFVPDATVVGRYAPYYHWNKTGKELVYVNLDTPKYDYPNQPWFKVPIVTNVTVWSEPYFDEGGGDILMMTYSTPVDVKDNVIAIATVDISIQEIVNKIKNLTVSGKGYAFMVTKEGFVLAHPQMGELSKESLWEIATKTKDRKLINLIEIIRRDDTTFEEITDPFTKTPSIVLTTKIKSIDGKLVIIYPRDQVLKPLFQLKDEIIVISLVVIALLIVLIFWLSESLTKPITKLVEQTQLYSQGFWTQRLNENAGTKEIRELSKSFNKMGQAIIDQIENVKQTTAQKERYAQELTIAAEIQQSILPQQFPPFPDLVDTIDMYGLTKPAREIGGDFYDFFRISKDVIGIVIADVSDKGAPSSFFMAMARMLVREMGERGLSPAEIFRRTNYVLSRDNAHSMFVTMIYGEYNVNTGQIRFVNAGHNPPLIISTDGLAHKLSLKINLPLGIMPETHYKVDEHHLNPGETLMLYTDGVTEAHNKAGEQLGMGRFVNRLTNNPHTESKALVNDVLELVKEFAIETEQADDITLLCLKNLNTSKTAHVESKFKYHDEITMTMPAKTEVLEKIACVITSVAQDLGFQQKEIDQITLAVDEIVTNVIMHSYEQAANETFQIEIIPRNDGIYISITDYGVPFNFEEKVEAYNAEDASVNQLEGGIGLYLARKSVDEMWYEPDTITGNKVSIIKYLKQ